MSSSFFSSVTRYPRTPDSDPRENRLTECFAAVLRVVPELTERLLTAWGIDAPLGRISDVRTQQMTSTGHFIDVQISYGPRGVASTLIWIEVKHASGLGRAQMLRYQRDLLVERAQHRELVLLAPSRLKADEPLPPTARHVTWESVADACREARADLSEPVKIWLLDQFVAYLEEEGLSQSNLNKHHVSLLRDAMDTWRVLDALITLTVERVDARWGKRVSPKRLTATIDVEFRHETHPVGSRRIRTWRDARFYWGCAADERVDDPNVYAFFASAWLGKARPELKEDNRRWLAALGRKGYEYVPDGRDAWLNQWLSPAELVGKGSLPEQAEFLATWILRSFRGLGSPPT